MDDAKARPQESAALFGYISDGDRGDHCDIDVRMVAIPSANEASVANPFRILPDREAARFACSHIIKTRSEWPPLSVLKSKRVRAHVVQGQYPQLVKNLLDARMVTLRPSSDEVIENTIFGVWKEPQKSQRLIWAGNRSNLLFNPAASAVQLPTPDIIGSLYIKEWQDFCVAGCDISQYYNRLQAPPNLIPLLGMPKLPAAELGLVSDSEYVTPCLTCVPMGATFSVALAQAVSSAALRQEQALPVPPDFVSPLDTQIPKQGLVLPYIDDVTSIAPTATRANNNRDLAASALAAVQLNTDPRKNFSSDERPYQVALGLAWWRDGVLTVKPSHALRLYKLTNPVVASRRASPALVRRIVGLWSYALLLRRPAFSILYQAFAFTNEEHPDKCRRLPDSVVEELSTLLDVFPLLFADLRQPLASRVYFSDACGSGGGVQYADLSARDSWTLKENIKETRVRKGWLSTLSAAEPEEDKQFEFADPSADLKARPLAVSRRFQRAIERLQSKTAISHRWLYDDHINVLEAEAALLAFRHMYSTTLLRGQRVLSLIDNTSALGAVAKGRSSSYRLNKVCRKIAGVLLNAHLTPLCHWVPSSLNLADTPSRRFENDRKKALSNRTPP